MYYFQNIMKFQVNMTKKMLPTAALICNVYNMTYTLFTQKSSAVRFTVCDLCPVSHNSDRAFNKKHNMT